MSLNLHDNWESGGKLYTVMDRLVYTYGEELEHIKQTQNISSDAARVIVHDKYLEAILGLANEKGFMSTDIHIGNIMFTSDHERSFFE